MIYYSFLLSTPVMHGNRYVGCCRGYPVVRGNTVQSYSKNITFKFLSHYNTDYIFQASVKNKSKLIKLIIHFFRHHSPLMPSTCFHCCRFLNTFLGGLAEMPIYLIIYFISQRLVLWSLTRKIGVCLWRNLYKKNEIINEK